MIASFTITKTKFSLIKTLALHWPEQASDPAKEIIPRMLSDSDKYVYRLKRSVMLFSFVDVDIDVVCGDKNLFFCPCSPLCESGNRELLDICSMEKVTGIRTRR